ncbi:MAG: DUF6186 family protein [Acidimicrobiales bacterium]|jgi:hypothetical protein
MISHQWTLLVWGVLGLVVLALLASALLTRGRFPGPGALVVRITATNAGRALVVVGWAWLGWHLFAR